MGGDITFYHDIVPDGSNISHEVNLELKDWNSKLRRWCSAMARLAQVTNHRGLVTPMTMLTYAKEMTTETLPTISPISPEPLLQKSLSFNETS
jgi:hypothetical protein